jgi:hypothetical protein
VWGPPFENPNNLAGMMGLGGVWPASIRCSTGGTPFALPLEFVDGGVWYRSGALTVVFNFSGQITYEFGFSGDAGCSVGGTMASLIAAGRTSY